MKWCLPLSLLFFPLVAFALGLSAACIQLGQATEKTCLPTNSREGSIAAMRHRSWEPLRIQASDVLRVLESAILRNAAYFTLA